MHQGHQMIGNYFFVNVITLKELPHRILERRGTDSPAHHSNIISFLLFLQKSIQSLMQELHYFCVIFRMRQFLDYSPGLMK